MAQWQSNGVIFGETKDVTKDNLVSNLIMAIELHVMIKGAL